MPVYQDKRNKRLYIEFQYKGRRYKERLPKDVTRASARHIEAKWRSDLMFASHGIDTVAPVTFEDFLIDTFEATLGKYHPDNVNRAEIDPLPFQSLFVFSLNGKMK